MRAPVRKAYVIRFFQLVTAKQLAEAERELQRIKEKIERTEWNHGYYRALQGMLLTRRNNNDQYSFFTSLDHNDKQTINNARKDFQERSESRLYADYDRGYFSAWAEYMRVLIKMQRTAMPISVTKPTPAQIITHAQPPTSDANSPAQTSLANWQEKQTRVENAEPTL
ncbi:MAG: hypothetical protein ACQXXH_04595 [Candidatus Bathyarchaeia archaeon]|jgi:hypothetical protein|nr:hypothetical protein [Candidatus Bathyarchaeota archaeon A05DMB-4]MDH7595015.1 hypothetical protein [Candidatus Bathyarchaeota archaeon]